MCEQMNIHYQWAKTQHALRVIERDKRFFEALILKKLKKKHYKHLAYLKKLHYQQTGTCRIVTDEWPI